MEGWVTMVRGKGSSWRSAAGGGMDGGCCCVGCWSSRRAMFWPHEALKREDGVSSTQK